MIKTTAMMLEELHNYASPASELSHMTARGECVQIVKGLYETDKSVLSYLLAGSIYGPSYISFEYATSCIRCHPRQMPRNFMLFLLTICELTWMHGKSWISQSLRSLAASITRRM